MPEIRPFRGWKYNQRLIGNVDNVVSAHDTIEEDLRSRLLSRSPYNVVGIISKNEKISNIHRAAAAQDLIAEWKRREVLTQDRYPSLYVLHQIFTIDGQEYNRKGFISVVNLDPTRSHSIFPHERTFEEPTLAKFATLRDTRVSSSAIFGLYTDSDNVIQNFLENSIAGELPSVTARDHLGNTNILWTVSDPFIINCVQKLMETKKVVIADGHHRYEAALRYRSWFERRHGHLDNNHPANFGMMCLVNADDPALMVLPTHRIISGLQQFSSHDLLAALEDQFDITIVGRGREAAERLWRTLSSSSETALSGVGTPLDKCWHLLRPRVDAHSIAAPHEIVLNKMKNARPNLKTDYIHDRGTVLEALDIGKISILMSPPKVHHVLKVAGNGDFMPQKSTFFYPKMLSGLIMQSLEEDMPRPIWNFEHTMFGAY